jgi:transketolase
MTDRELLELAAKAAEIPWPFAVDRDNKPKWNPLTDDGDALRLVVKLGLSLKHYYYAGDYFIKVSVNGVAMSEAYVPVNREVEITRRAIVRAAAEIGKEMK